MPGFRCKKATSAPGVQWSVRGSDVLPVNTIGGMGSSNVPPFGIQLVRKVPGWRPLGLVLGADPQRIGEVWAPEEGAEGALYWGWETVRELAAWPPL